MGASKQEIGIVMGSFAIGLLLSRPMLGRLADERGRKIVLLIGTIVAAIAPFGYLATKSIGLLILVRIFHGISIAAFTTGYSALVADLAPAQTRGEIIGYMTLATPIGLAIGYYRRTCRLPRYVWLRCCDHFSSTCPLPHSFEQKLIQLTALCTRSSSRCLRLEKLKS